MKFSWKRSTFALFTGLLITGCATNTRQPQEKPLLMSSRGGVVPQPFEEPKAPVVINNQTPIMEPGFVEPVTPVIPNEPVIVEPVKPITPVKKTPTQSTKGLEKYTVVKGDSLSRIAYKFKGFSYFELAKVNGIDVNKPLKIGQVLVIPKKGVKKNSVNSSAKKSSTKTVAKKKTTPKKKSKNSGKKAIPANGKYVVKSGDSLWLIAHRYGISTKEIKRLNNLKSETLHIGNVLVLKGDAKAAAKPVVAEKKPVIKDVKPLTPVTNDEVKPLAPVTPKIVEQDNEPVAVEELDSTPFVEDVTIDENNKDIKSISDMFSVSIEDIQAQNKGVDLNNLKVGQIIKVPLGNN